MSPFPAPAKALLWVIALYHIVLGLLLIYSGELSIRAADAMYGWQITGSPELGILGEILGCYAIAFGLMMAVAAGDPVRYRSLLTVGIVLIALRLLQRLIFAGKVMEVFQVSSGRYWSAFVFVLLLGALLTWVRLLARRETAA